MGKHGAYPTKVSELSDKIMSPLPPPPKKIKIFDTLRNFEFQNAEFFQS